ncbi:BON domain-containing protein [Methylobacterium sp. E-041]|uniref:BON domain-containing protein n=1 Tax=unclassified Methylobacterium TaxID=2615210 RepID=UPI0011CA083A|nr:MULTISPECIES: BON domain-containing protein [unclassified Methylobacterium]MCJ2008291.1 BON domain-containing protein [Methylobacterium sp. J-092]MCJ2039110.1 BON domain-containing protein [Methylobacterium sp. J-059]MCJ2076682.1 BON domain-containing protein [Methylobacterium sp. E-016]MCJ2105588.1 BON domain-containing protein [Methylobacterium sp. E-041]TXM95444.1 BON domain-containing protein [Methylobacterium sp. WL116]
MSHDTSLQHRVTAELIWDPAVTSSEIGVTARDGVVALSGQVGTYDEKIAAEAAACRVRGVRALVQEIEVVVPYARKRSDEDIAATAIARLAWNVAVPPDRVMVKVSKGTVILTGDVDHRFQSEVAERELRQLSGVVAVNNRIVVKPQVDVEAVSDSISEALDRSWLFDPKTVTVKADGGTVYLGGTVRTMQERREAMGAAWASPGTTAVENRISVV